MNIPRAEGGRLSESVANRRQLLAPGGARGTSQLLIILMQEIPRLHTQGESPLTVPLAESMLGAPHDASDQIEPGVCRR